MDTNHAKLFVVSAPTGAGKTTVVNEFFKKHPLLVNRVITYTTRPQTAGEIDGKDYFFVSPADFEKKQKQDFFLETTIYDDFLYGSPRSILDAMDSGTSFIMITDRPGALYIKKLVPHAITIWLTVSHVQTLFDRLISRHRETDQRLAERIALAKQEYESELDQKNFTYYVLNDDVRVSVQNLEDIIKSNIRNT
jgi:guanylate kinase